jgi:predicted methyltransferase
MKRLITAALLAAGLFTGAAQADDALKAVISGSHRAPANVARDAARHPYETLKFFGITPTMTVVDLQPSSGWYTEILAPYLREKGKFIGSTEPMIPANRYSMAFQRKLDSNKALYDKVGVSVFEPGVGYNIAPAGSVDMILTFREVHNWPMNDVAKRTALLKAIYDTLKPGGVFGVVDHRLPASRKDDGKSGYIHEAAVISMVEAAGFKLAAKSEINANPKDTADHPRGVWTLPPSYALKDVDRAKYEAIGESDRMTLKFVKP